MEQGARPGARAERLLPSPNPETQPLAVSKPAGPRPPHEKHEIFPRPWVLFPWQTSSSWYQPTGRQGGVWRVAAGRTMTWSEGVRAWRKEEGEASAVISPAHLSPCWPSNRSRRIANGFLLKPMSICEEVPWRSASDKLRSPVSPKGSSGVSNYLNAPNSSSDWSNSMRCSWTLSLPSSVSAAY